MAQLKTILLAEDSPHDVELTLTALNQSKSSNKVVVVRDGVEALDYLYRRGKFQGRNEENPVMLILDLKMPKVDGLQVLKQMKSDATLKAIPVVMLTSSREEADLVQSYQLGVNAYVVKPIGFQQFMGAVEQLGMFWMAVNEPPPVRQTSE
jgi:CheY-like chemotaxis protein